MHFATPLPWWLATPAIAGLIALAYLSYRRPVVPLSSRQRVALIALRALTLLCLLAVLCRPVLSIAPLSTGDVVVPVLIDVSRSMRIADAGGASRLSRAVEIARQAAAALSPTASVELLRFSDRVEPAALDELRPDGRSTDIGAALDAVDARYRGQRVAGIVLLTDGGDAARAPSRLPARDRAPVFAVGIGSPEGPPDREVVALTATDPRLDQTSAELRVTFVSRGLDRDPFQLTVLANGQAVETRRVMPADAAAPTDEVFTVFPDTSRASLYSAVLETAPGEQVIENNRRSVALGAAKRRRRVLVLAGAPGYDHSFMLRALGQDGGLDADTVVRKGKNDANKDTFLVQAGAGRASLLTGGFPATKDALFGYDAVVLANIESDFFTSAQLGELAAFVSERGGGLLVTGGRSFERRGLTATPLEEVLPVELTDRRGGELPEGAEDQSVRADHAAITAEGLRHPLMRIGPPDQLSALWATLPPLTSAAPLGGPRPGGSVLATTIAGNGARLPLIAVQRYGRGRSMVFAGEASWRWRMLQPSTDRRFDYFWRQSVRWLANDAPEPVSISLPHDLDAGDPVAIELEVRDRTFAPVDGTDVDIRLTSPTGTTAQLTARPAGAGRAIAIGTLGGPGLYHVEAEAQHRGTMLGRDDRWLAAGGGEREFLDPRLNEGGLRRLVRETGGRYVPVAAATSLLDELAGLATGTLQPRQRELWHEPWTFALIVLMLSAEWTLRRLWGLR